MPDSWMAAVPADPAARYTLRESVALAFIAALQVLTPVQRATLLLRDVVGMSAEEAAGALDQSVAAVNSALHRARVAIDEKVAHRDPASFAAGPADVAALAGYMRAIADCDVEAMIALMHERTCRRRCRRPRPGSAAAPPARCSTAACSRPSPAARCRSSRSASTASKGSPSSAAAPSAPSRWSNRATA
jgi:hypothetical protein